MALLFTPQILGSGFDTVDSLGENFTDIQTALADGLSRSGDTPNEMNADLDMNSNRILNLPDATNGSEPLTFSQATLLAGGSFAVYGTYDTTATWVRDANGGAWNPVGTTQDIIVQFFRAAVQVASRTIRVTRDANGLITVTTVGTTGEATTLGVVNNNTVNPTATITHTDSQVKVVPLIQATVGGESGSPLTNILPAEYSDFEDSTLPPITSAGGTTTVSLDATQSRIGGQSLKIEYISGPNFFAEYFGTSTTDYNLNIEPNRRWLVIARVRQDTLRSMSFGLKFNDATTISGTSKNPTTINTWETLAWEIDATSKTATTAELFTSSTPSLSANDITWLDGISLVDITDFSSIDDSSFPSAYIPSGQGEPARLFYIKPITGTAIKNSVGTITVEAHELTGGVDVLLSSGTIKLFEGATEITVANGYAAGSDGYTGVFDSGDISDSVLVVLKDGAGGTVLDSITLIDVTDGAAASDAHNGFLTNETHTVQAANDGTGYSLTGAGGTFKVFEGATDVTTSSTFSIVGGTDQGATWDKVQNGLTFTINETTGVYSLSGASWTSDLETFTVQAVHSTVTVEKVYTIAKSKAGADGSAGADADLIHLTADNQAFSYDYTNPDVPVLIGPSSINFTVNRQNIASSTTWNAWDHTGAAITPVSNILTSTTDTSAVMTEANFASITNNDFIRVRATGDAVFDEITIVELRTGESPVVGAVEASNGLAWTRAINGGAWTPAGTTTDLTATFYRGGSSIATRTVRITLNTSDGTLLASLVGNTGETTSPTITGDGTTSVNVKFTHDASGADVSENVISVQGGNSGVDGVAPFTSFQGSVGAFTSADILRKNELGNGTTSNGDIGIDDSTWLFLDGSSYDTGGTLTLNTPYVSTTRTAEQFYVILGATNADTRFGGSWDNHRFFVAELDSATQVWTAVAGDNTTTGYTPIATDAIVGIGSRPSTADTGIKFLSTVAHRMSLNSTTAPQFIQNAAITNALVGNLSATKITTDQLSAARINIDGITLGTSGSSLIVATGGIGSTQLGANSVITSKIAANQVTATQIAAATITAAEIAGGTITGSKIAGNTITGSNIAATTITAGEIQANAITTDKLNGLAVTTGKVADGAISQVSIRTPTDSGGLTTGSWQTAWSESFTAELAGSDLLIVMVAQVVQSSAQSTARDEFNWRLRRGTTNLVTSPGTLINSNYVGHGYSTTIAISYKDTPADTSSHSYNLQLWPEDATVSVEDIVVTFMEIKK